MRIQNSILFILLIWFGIEFIAFALVVQEVGLSGALLLGLATTIAGFSILRRIGLGAALALKKGFGQNFGNERVASENITGNGSWAAVGAILLILPGFVSDLIGFCLVTPSLRNLLSKLPPSFLGAASNHNRTEPSVIELSPQEWTRIENPRDH